MGEKNTAPKENPNNQTDKMNSIADELSETPPMDEMDTHSDNNEDEEEEDMTPEEFAALDTQLDALNSALDDIEQKNDDIHSQLVQLLDANREIRQQLQQDKSKSENQSDSRKANEPKQE